VKSPTCDFRSFSKRELEELADRLLAPDPIAVEWCVTFFEKETRGVGHGRVRAKIARRLKHCELGKLQRNRLTDVILRRLAEGRFSEQFTDQLRLALHLDRSRTIEAAIACRDSPLAHVRRRSEWVAARPAP
jgi:hypothetical protein